MAGRRNHGRDKRSKSEPRPASDERQSKHHRSGKQSAPRGSLSRDYRSGEQSAPRKSLRRDYPAPRGSLSRDYRLGEQYAPRKSLRRDYPAPRGSLSKDYRSEERSAPRGSLNRDYRSREQSAPRGSLSMDHPPRKKPASGESRSKERGSRGQSTSGKSRGKDSRSSKEANNEESQSSDEDSEIAVRVVQTLRASKEIRISVVEDTNGGKLVLKEFHYWSTIGSTPTEAQVLEYILPEHDNLIQICWWTRRFEKTFALQIFYEYCAGNDLGYLVPYRLPGTLPESFVWHVFVQLAVALRTVHDRGTQEVIHRCIEPSNVYLEYSFDPDGPYPTIILGNFSRATIDPGARGPCSKWTGPEIVAVGKPGDVWSVGAIVHALGHGVGPVVPLSGNNISEQAEREWLLNPEARKPLHLPQNYSERLNDHMMSCLRTKPEERVSSRQLVENLRRDSRGRG